MATLTIYPDKEHSVTNAPGNYGNSKDNHAPVGLNSSTGWRYRDLLRFALNGIPSGAKLVDATLRMKTSGGTHMGMGSGPSVRIRRLTEAFSATGGSGETWQTSADPAGFGTGSTASDEQVYSFGSAENTVRDFSIIGIVEDQAPTNVLRRSGSACGGDNVGIELRAADEGNTNDRIEFWSTRGSYKPRLIVEYTMEADPAMPTIVSPGGTVSAVPTELVFTVPAGDTATEYELKVGTFEAGSDMWNVAATVLPGGGSPYHITYAGAALTPGVPYFWQVRTVNASGAASGWQGSDFYVTPAPIISFAHPPASGRAHIWNLGVEAKWTDSALAKPRVRVNYSHPTGLKSSVFEVKVNGGAPITMPLVVDSGQVATLDIDQVVARNTDFTVEVRAQGAGGLWSSSITRTMRVNWAQGIYRFTHAGGATAFAARHAALTGGSGTQVAYLYKKTPDADTEWKDTITAVSPGTSMDVLVRLSTSETTQNPALPSAKVEWSEEPPIYPDFWEATNAVISQDAFFRRFGIHSLHVVPTAAGVLRNTIGSTVSPSTKYTFSAFVHTGGLTLTLPIALVLFREDGVTAIDPIAGGGVYSTVSSVGKGNEDWQRLYATYEIPAGTTVVRPALSYGAGAVKEFWVDAFQFEEGTVATGWKPGLAGPAVVVDVGGIAVDGSYGGIFRLRAADGSIIELRSDGLYADGVRLPGSGGGGSSDHGTLTGLGDDDHPQYTTAAEAAAAASSAVATHAAAGDPHAGYATDGDLSAHAAAADPHPGYLTPAEGNAAYEASGAVSGHAAAGDPHTGYRLESADHSHATTGLQGGQVAHSALSGVTADQHHAQAHAISGADHTGTLTDAQIPSTIARDTEVAAAVTAHEGLGDPHTGYLTEAAHGGVSPTGHHAQAHALVGADHSASGLTAGHVLRATAATTFAFGAIADGDLPATIARDSEVTAAVVAHEALSNPHAGYATDADLTAHAATSHGSGGPPPKRTIFGAGSGNWTKTGSPRYIEVEVIGGGGGSGGGASTASGASAVSGGGGGGGYCKAIFDASALTTVAYVAGAAGTAGTAGNNNGGAGGNSSWGSTILTANGGGAGTGAASTTGNSTANGGTGGAAGGTEATKIAVPGGDGGNGESIGGIRVYSGTGGGSPYGPMQTPGNGAGRAGNGYGGGGGGAANGGSASAVAGGAGAAGAVIVTEYY